MRHTTVSEVMAKDVVTVTPTTSFSSVAKLLHDAGVRAVPVVDPEGVLLGVVSEADLMASAARSGPGSARWARHTHRNRPEAKVGATTAAELMTAFVEAVAPTTTVATAARLMMESHLRWMPVCDEAGRVVGVLSRSDVLTVFMRDDDSIRTEIVQEVPGGNADGVQVDVRDGVVTLTGEVATRGDAERLAKAVERVEGAVAVVDQLTYRVDERLADARATPMY